MSRKDPPKTPPVVRKSERSGWAQQIRKYKVITPLYGGGAIPAEADALTVVRASEVRGHLRFWWRATRGGAFGGDLKKMKVAEENIWGAAAASDNTGQSMVIITAKKDVDGVADHPFEVVKNLNGKPQVKARSGSSAHPYVAFPLQPEQKEARPGMKTKSVLTGVLFTLEIRYDERYKKDVETALWAWEYFGGIGARTRRGFGALQCVEIDGNLLSPPSSQKMASYLQGQLKSMFDGHEVWHPGVPHLSTDTNRYRLTNIGTTPIGAWTNLIDALKRFRQARRAGADNNNRPGRSYWSEPEEIRKLTHQRLPDHRLLPNAVEKFPRAKFGLPIIFHFKDMNRFKPNDPSSDPHDTTLQGFENDRLASPLILRTLVCSDGAVGLAAVLEWDAIDSAEIFTPPGGLILKGAPDDPKVESDLEEDQAATIPPLKGNPDILQAFLDSLR